MIISRLRGGLGNQLFQYAAGRALAQKHQTELKLDISSFDKEPTRWYALDNFRISATILSHEERTRLGLSAAPQGRIENIFERYFGSKKIPLIRERTFEFDPAVLDSPKECCLDGYWQSPKYFAGIDSQIRDECAAREPLQGKNLQVATEIQNCPAVSLHVRRGDYVTQAHTNRYHGTCDQAYYAAAEGLIRKACGDVRLFVFSDDPDWAESNLRFVSPATIVRHNGPRQDFEDLRLMSLCRHHVIANSTFSWWGAWLSAQPGKIVVAPKNWFKAATMRSDDLVPGGWIRL